jgi:hypothetical protein
MSDQFSQERTDLVGQSLASPVWGNVSYEVTQDFGVLGFRPDWYEYSKYHGFPPGYHIGLDVGTPRGTPVFANADAMVKQAGFSDSFRPNPVVLETIDDKRTSVNEAGITETYGHLWSDTVVTGQTVHKGELLGYTGEQTIQGTMTPDGSGPHIHFEVYDRKGNAVNPLPMLKANFVPQPGSAPQPGTGNQYDFPTPGNGVIDCLKDPTGCLTNELSGIKSALVSIASRSVVALIGIVLLVFGFYAVVSGTSIKKTAKSGVKLATVL